MKAVLFLCTGNYYRSRFAEELFNHRVEAEGLAWIATSRALAIERGVNNVGAVSPFALSALDRLGVVARGRDRRPAPCLPADLMSADRIVALSQSEHRGLMQQRFPEWADRVAYWQVEDIGLATPEAALGEIARRIEDMLTAVRAT